MINNLEKLKEFPFSNPRNFKIHDYYYPVIYSLITSSSGISFTIEEIFHLLKENLKLSDEYLNRPLNKNKVNFKVIYYRVWYAVYYLYRLDFLDREKRKGNNRYFYSLSSLGKKITNETTLMNDIKNKSDESNTNKELNEKNTDDCTTSDESLIKKSNDSPDKNLYIDYETDSDEEDRDEDAPDETNTNNWKEKMLADLHSLSYTGFEKFCVEFLEAMGVKDIAHTGKSCDKGIDIEGEIEINFFIKYKVVVQCKRYAPGNNVSSDDIMKLKGSMAHTNAQKAVFITTSNYTKEALKDAKSNNKDQHIELINGNDLCDYIVKYMSDTYVETNYVYNLNEKELEKFKD